MKDEFDYPDNPKFARKIAHDAMVLGLIAIMVGFGMLLTIIFVLAPLIHK